MVDEGTKRAPGVLPSLYFAKPKAHIPCSGFDAHEWRWQLGIGVDEKIELDWELFDTATRIFNFPEWSLDQSPLPHYTPSPLSGKMSYAATGKPASPPAPEPVLRKGKDVVNNPELPITSSSAHSSPALMTKDQQVPQRPLQARNSRSPSAPAAGSHNETPDGKLGSQENRRAPPDHSVPPCGPSFGIRRRGPTQAGSPHEITSQFVDTGSAADQEKPVDDSHSERSPTTAINHDDTPNGQGLAQSRMSGFSGGSPNDEVYDDISELDSPSDFSRSPSPWQTASPLRSHRTLYRALAWVKKRLDSEPGLQENEGKSPEPSRTASLSTPGGGGLTHHPVGCAAGGSPTSASQSQAPQSSSSTTTSGPTGSKRTHNLISQDGDADDGEGNEPTRRRLGRTTPGQQPVRPRFACPYQKYDPLGSPKCCMPGPRNDTGGAETVSRVK